jgi:hypothetical protein
MNLISLQVCLTYTSYFRWIHYWYDKDALTDFGKTVLKMMGDIFYDKLSGELQVPVSEGTIQQAVVACTNDDNFLIQIMKQCHQNEHGVTKNWGTTNSGTNFGKGDGYVLCLYCWY